MFVAPQMKGCKYDALCEMAQREERLLITTDRGFTRYRTVSHHGMLIIRLRRPSRHKIHQRIMQPLTQFDVRAMARFTGSYARCCHGVLGVCRRLDEPSAIPTTQDKAK